MPQDGLVIYDPHALEMRAAEQPAERTTDNEREPEAPAAARGVRQRGVPVVADLPFPPPSHPFNFILFCYLS